MSEAAELAPIPLRTTLADRRSPRPESRDNPSLDANVRRRGLAEAHGEPPLDEEAERVVTVLYETVLLRPEVRTSLRADTTLSEPMRRRALALAEQIPQSPFRPTRASWSVACQRSAPPETHPPGLEAGRGRLGKLEPAMQNSSTPWAWPCTARGITARGPVTLTQSDCLTLKWRRGRNRRTAFLANLTTGSASQNKCVERPGLLAGADEEAREHVSTSEAQLFLSEAEAIELDLAFPSQPFAP